MTCVTLEPTPPRASKVRGIASSRRALPQRSANCEASTGSLRPECAETPQEASTRRWPPLSIRCCGRRDWPLYSASLQGGMAVTLHGLCGYAKGALPPWPKWKSLNSVTALFNRSSPAQTCGGGPARLMRSASPSTLFVGHDGSTTKLEGLHWLALLFACACGCPLGPVFADKIGHLRSVETIISAIEQTTER